ncbi:MAG: hypothetical protein Q9201_001995 [Fulgogasparrea decipioides]
MTFPTAPPILSELRSSTSSASQLAALRTLKNDIIGHEQRKRMWIGQGVLVPLVRIITTTNGNGKRRDQNGTRTAHHNKTTFSRGDEEEARLQAIIVVGSLAYGGPAYVPPITASSVIGPLIALLSATGVSAKIVLATLRTLNTIADASALEPLGSENRGKGLVHSLYTDDGLDGIVQLLSQTSNAQAGQHQVSLTARLIAKTCHDESQRNLLVRKGVLEALASRLATFIAAKDSALCTARVPCDLLGSPGALPAPSQLRLAPILGAIGRIVDTSKSRATAFLSAPALTAVLLRLEADAAVPYEEKAGSWHNHGRTSVSNRTSSRRLEFLLPHIPSFTSKGSIPESSCHPPLGAIGTSGRQSYSARATAQAQDSMHSQAIKSAQEEQNLVVAWLMYVVQAETGVSRLMAAWVISLFYRSGLIDKQRESSLAMLLVPLLVRVLEKDMKSAGEARSGYDVNPRRPASLDNQEQAPAILAMLTLDSLDLQRAAVDAGAIKKLAQLLKESYDPLPADSNASQWTAEPSLADGSDGSDETCYVGDSTASAAVYQAVRVRESVLMALASIASTRDDYRKAIIENGVVPFVIESLKSNRGLQAPENHDQTRAHLYNQDPPFQPQNSVGVILAACGAARSLSRSVSTLRTSLMDAGLAAPLFALLRHQDVKVQIAATAVISNLVLEFSPMREAILEAGVLKTLCEQARSRDPNLRLSSIWALKHLVLSAPRLLKRECLGELGPGWLKQVICSGEGDSASGFGVRADREASVGTPLAMGTPNAAGEQVDLLNAVDGSGEGRQAANEEDEEDLKMTDSVGALGGPDSDSQQQDRHHSSWQAPRRRVDVTATDQLRADDLAVQKQGLDFIRNLVCGSDSVEMIECLFEELGQDKMFEILISKLRPRLINAFNRERRSSENGVRQLQPQTDIVISVCYIIVHLAAGSPRHRQLLISQPELLKLIVPLFSHSHREVRGCCAWIVINLTWMDDQSDHPNCKERARELIRLGMYEKLQMLESDPELDVRERTKTAIYQITCANR